MKIRKYVKSAYIIAKSMYVKVKSYLLTQYYKHYKIRISLPNEKGKGIIVSLTTYPARFLYVVYAVKSMFHQTILPNKIIIWLDDDVKEEQIPTEMREFEKYGVEIKFRKEDIKPHKKYYYAMKEYQDSVIITIDDDCIYNRRLIEKLIKGMKKNPNSITAARVHRIKGAGGITEKYNAWDWEYKMSYNTPDFLLFATGVGGVLYPPHLLDLDVLLNMENILNHSKENDDIWLKYCELLSNIPVQAVRCPMYINVYNSQGVSLNSINVCQNRNDVIISDLNEFFGFNLFDKCCEKNGEGA